MDLKLFISPNTALKIVRTPRYLTSSYILICEKEDTTFLGVRKKNRDQISLITLLPKIVCKIHPDIHISPCHAELLKFLEWHR